MCLGIPGEVIELRDDGELPFAKVRFGGVAREVCIAYVPDAKPGDFVLVHVGFAIARIDAEEAARTMRVLEELGAASELEQGEVRQEPPRSGGGEGP